MEEDKGGKKKGGGFQSLNLKLPILRGVLNMGYRVPTPVQRKVLPVALARQDVVCMARTGSGKTCAFLVPCLNLLEKHSSETSGARALILSPTRELAIQTFKFAKQMARYTDLRMVLLVGGDSMERQFEELTRHPDLIIGTPGRVMHHLEEVPDFSLQHIQALVFDEADRLFEMGFTAQISEIMKRLPKERNTLLFSATLPKVLVQFAQAGLRDPVVIRLDTDTKISEGLRLGHFFVRHIEKTAALLWILRELVPDDPDRLIIIFVATKHHVEYLLEVLRQAQLDATAIYGSMDQGARTINLSKFRSAENPLGYGRGGPWDRHPLDRFCYQLLLSTISEALRSSSRTSSKAEFILTRCNKGRSGYAISLIDTEEVPYLYDLSLFLGRLVSIEEETYSLDSMKVDQCHFGGIPQEIIDKETEELARLESQIVEMQSLKRTKDNAMKQYRRSRPEASKTSVHRAKEAVAFIRDGAILHPLVKSIWNGDKSSAKSSLVGELRSFKPKQTVFEVFANQGMSTAVEIVNVLRKQREVMETIPEKKKDHQRRVEGSDDKELPKAKKENRGIRLQGMADPNGGEKRHLSKAERKRMKKARLKGDGKVVEPVKEAPVMKSKSSFKDETFYISYGPEEDTTYEEGLQPMADMKASEREGLEKLMMDLPADEAIEMHRKRQVMHWDSKKKKYIKASISELAEKGVKSKIRTESGIKLRKSSTKKGSIYEKWRNKTKRGLEDDDDKDMDTSRTSSGKMATKLAKRRKITKNVGTELRNIQQIKKYRRETQNKKKSGPKIRGKRR